jgi:hypothetical protein
MAEELDMFKAFTSRIQDLSKELDNLRTNMPTFKQFIHAMDTESQKKAGGDIAETIVNRGTLTKDIHTKLLSHINTLNGEISQYKTKIQKHLGDIQRLNGENSRQAIDIGNQRKEIDRLEGIISQQKIEIEKHLEEIQSLKGKTSQQKTKIHNTADQPKAENEVLKQRNAAAQNRIAKLELANTALRSARDTAGKLRHDVQNTADQHDLACRLEQEVLQSMIRADLFGAADEIVAILRSSLQQAENVQIVDLRQHYCPIYGMTVCAATVPETRAAHVEALALCQDCLGSPATPPWARFQQVQVAISQTEPHCLQKTAGILLGTIKHTSNNSCNKPWSQFVLCLIGLSNSLAHVDVNIDETMLDLTGPLTRVLYSTMRNLAPDKVNEDAASMLKTNAEEDGVLMNFNDFSLITDKPWLFVVNKSKVVSVSREMIVARYMDLKADNPTVPFQISDLPLIGSLQWTLQLLNLTTATQAFLNYLSEQR